MNTKEWEIELEKLDLCECERNDTGKFQTELIKDFIRSLLSSHTQEIRDSVMKLKNSKIIGIVGATKRNANFKNDGWHDALKKVLQILESNE